MQKVKPVDVYEPRRCPQVTTNINAALTLTPSQSRIPTFSMALFFVGWSIQSFSFSNMSVNAQRMPSISSSIWQSNIVSRWFTPTQAWNTWPCIMRPTHHVFLVLLKVLVDKEAPGGINKRVLHVIDALIPARGQGGGSCGHLLGMWGHIDLFFHTTQIYTVGASEPADLNWSTIFTHISAIKLIQRALEYKNILLPITFTAL